MGDVARQQHTQTCLSISSISYITSTNVAADGVSAGGVSSTTSFVCCTLVDICVITNQLR